MYKKNNPKYNQAIAPEYNFLQKNDYSKSKKQKIIYTIIGNIKDTYYNRNFVIYKIIYHLLKIIFYTLILNKKKFTKHQNILIEIYKNKKYEIVGHKSLQLSLHRGFERLKIPYLYNKVTEDIDYIILLWIDEKDLKLVEKLKNKYHIKKVVTVPTACKFDYTLMYRFAHYDCIDHVLCASEKVVKECQEKLENKYKHKLISWPSGVELGHKKDQIYNRCIVYIKETKNYPCKLDNKVITILENLGINYKLIIYGKYNYENWQSELKMSDFVIFYQNNPETQGLAMAEAWAQDCPTFIKTKFKNNMQGTSPYLSQESGLYWENIEELEQILKNYSSSPEKFLKQFHPYDYVKKNLTDEISVKNLINILNNQ